MTEEVANDIWRAINAFPPIHSMELQNGKLDDNTYDGYLRLQDWAFVQRYTLIKESSRSDR